MTDLHESSGAPDPATWSCKIGEVPREELPHGSDWPMREAVRRAYRELTGIDPDFIFSGWGDELDEGERAVVENRDPDYAVILEDARDRVSKLEAVTIR